MFKKVTIDDYVFLLGLEESNSVKVILWEGRTIEDGPIKFEENFYFDESEGESFGSFVDSLLAVKLPEIVERLATLKRFVNSLDERQIN